MRSCLCSWSPRGRTRPRLGREFGAEHRPPTLRFLLGQLVLQHVPMLYEDAVRNAHPFVRQPAGPATGFAQVDSRDPPRHAFTRQQRVAILVESTTVYEDRVGQIGPVLDRTIGADFPCIARALPKGPSGSLERATRIEGEPTGGAGRSANGAAIPVAGS